MDPEIPFGTLTVISLRSTNVPVAICPYCLLSEVYKEKKIFCLLNEEEEMSFHRTVEWPR